MNAELEARKGVYAAGDAASYWDPTLGCRRRVEHLNFAEETGLLAGRNMAAYRLGNYANTDVEGKAVAKHYSHQSELWSSLGPNAMWEAVGSIDSKRLDTRSFFASDLVTKDKSTNLLPESDLGRLTKGVVFYLSPKERRLIGILLWNMDDSFYKDDDFPAPSRLNLARSILEEKRLVGRDSQTGLWSANQEIEELRILSRKFDFYGEVENYYNEMKSYFDSSDVEEIKINELLDEELPKNMS